MIIITRKEKFNYIYLSKYDYIKYINIKYIMIDNYDILKEIKKDDFFDNYLFLSNENRFYENFIVINDECRYKKEVDINFIYNNIKNKLLKKIFKDDLKRRIKL